MAPTFRRPIMPTCEDYRAIFDIIPRNSSRSCAFRVCCRRSASKTIHSLVPSIHFLSWKAHARDQKASRESSESGTLDVSERHPITVVTSPLHSLTPMVYSKRAGAWKMIAAHLVPVTETKDARGQ